MNGEFKFLDEPGVPGVEPPASGFKFLDESQGPSLQEQLANLPGVQEVGRGLGAAGQALENYFGLRPRTAGDFFPGTSIFEGKMPEKVAQRESVPLRSVREFAEQVPAGFVESASAGLAPELPAPVPEGAPAEIGKGVGELGGFLAGAPGAAARGTGKLGARLIGEQNIAKLNRYFLGRLPTQTALQAAGLSAAFGTMSAGDALEQSTLPEALDVIGKGATQGAQVGAIFGGGGAVFPKQRIMRIATILTALEGQRYAQAPEAGLPVMDERALSQKVFDYGMDLFFAWKGMGDEVLTKIENKITEDRAGGGPITDPRRLLEAAKEETGKSLRPPAGTQGEFKFLDEEVPATELPGRKEPPPIELQKEPKPGPMDLQTTYPKKPAEGQNLIDWIEGDISPQGDLAHLGTSTVFRELDRATTSEMVDVLDWAMRPERSPWVKRFIASESAAALRKRGLTPEKRNDETHEQRLQRLKEVLPLAEPEPATTQKKQIRLTEEERNAYIEKQVSEKTPAADQGEQQIVLFSGGPPGAGKSTAVKSVGVDKNKFLVADADLHKENFGYEDRADEFHEESSLINKKLAARSIEKGLHTLYDSLLSNYPLAEALLLQAKKKGARPIFSFTNIDAETSQMRSELRFRKHQAGLSKQEGASPRTIPVEVSVKGHNESLPTFIELYKKYGDDPEIEWELWDNNVDGRLPVRVFEQKGDRSTREIDDQKMFDLLMETGYHSEGEGEKLRYVRDRKITEQDIRASRARIEGRVEKNLQKARLGRTVPGRAPQPEPRSVRAPTEEVGAPRAPPVPAISGQKTTIKHAEGEDPASYALVESDRITPSHDMRRGFAKNEAYPEDVQERPYQRDRAHQTVVLSRANEKAFEPRFLVSDNPDAINGPPIATADGTVLGGNSRAMLVQYIYDRVPESAEKYRKFLQKNASRFGLDPKDVESMKAPMLVRVLDRPMDRAEMVRRVRRYNEPLTQAMEAKAEGVSRARLVSLETLESLAQDLGEGTLREYLGSDRSRAFIDRLVRDGVIEKTQINKLRNQVTGLLTEDGKRLVEQIVRGTVIDDLDILEALPPAVLQKVDRSLPAMSRIKARGEQWDISDPFKAALSEYAASKAAGQTFEEYMSIQGLFGESRKTEPKVTALMRALDEMKPTQFRRAMEEYARAAERDVAKQETFDFGTTETPDEAFERVFVPAEPGKTRTLGGEERGPGEQGDTLLFGGPSLEAFLHPQLKAKAKEVAGQIAKRRDDVFGHYLRWISGKTSPDIDVVLAKTHGPQVGQLLRNMESILSQTKEGRTIYETMRTFKGLVPRQTNEWQSRYRQSVKDLTPEQKREALNLLDTTEEITGNRPAEKAAAEVRTLLQDVRKYLVDNGHKVGYIEGYLPHIFQGRFWVKGEQGEGYAQKVETFGEALKIADELARKTGGKVTIMQDTFIPSDDATILSQKAYWRLIKNLREQVGEAAEVMNLSSKEAREMLDGVAKPKPRPRFFGNMRQRLVNNPNFIQDLDQVMDLYFYGASRKVAQDKAWRVIQRNLESMPEGDRPLRKFIEDVYMPQALAHPTQLEEGVARAISEHTPFKGLTGQDVRRIMHQINLPQYAWDLGVSMSSAVANATQFWVNGYPIVGEMSALRGYKRGLETFRDPKLLDELEKEGITRAVSSITGQVLLPKEILAKIKENMKGARSWQEGLQTAMETSLVPFSTVEMMNRFSTYWAGKDYAHTQLKKGRKAVELAKKVAPETSNLMDLAREIDSGKGDREAFARRFGYELNDKVNFRVGRENLPQLLQKTGFRLISPYKSFLLNQLKYSASALGPKGLVTDPAKAMRFVGATVALGGLRANPLLWGGFLAASALYEKFFGEDLAYELERRRLGKGNFLLRGLTGELGADISGSVAIMLPQRWEDVLGRFGQLALNLGKLAVGQESVLTERKIGRLAMPAQVQRVVDAIEIIEKGEYRTPITRTPVAIEKPWVAAVQRVFGALPKDVARTFDEEKAIDRKQKQYQQVNRDLTERWATAVQENDQKGIEKVLDRVVKEMDFAVERLGKAVKSGNDNAIIEAQTDIAFWVYWMKNQEKFENALERKLVPKQILEPTKRPTYLRAEALQ